MAEGHGSWPRPGLTADDAMNGQHMHKVHRLAHLQDRSLASRNSQGRIAKTRVSPAPPERETPDPSAILREAGRGAKEQESQEA